MQTWKQSPPLSNWQTSSEVNDILYLLFSVFEKKKKKKTIADEKLYHNKKKIQPRLVIATEYYKSCAESCAETATNIFLTHFDLTAQFL